MITGRGESYTHDVIILNYAGLVVETTKNKPQGGLTDIDGLQSYLFPGNNDEIKSDFKEVIDQIAGKTSLEKADIEEIRTIANCSGQYFSTKNRYVIISKILSYSGSESYEDLVLDLIENHGNDENFADEFLGYLNDDVNLLKALFRRMDNSVSIWGNEENFDRFLQVIFDLWLNSGFKEESRYQYYNHAFSGAIKPLAFNYDGSFWFPKTTYKPSFTKDLVKFSFEYTSSGVQKMGEIAYDFFQPVYIVNNDDGGLYTSKRSIPAIYLAGIIQKNNLDHSIKTLSFIADIGLTFTGVGNITKLRHLTKLKRGVRIIIGGIEIASSGLDVILNYTDICTDDEFCASLKEYNGYLQLALIGGEFISAGLKKSLKESKEKLSKDYAENRDKLIDKYSDDELKQLDNHFDYLANAGGSYFKSVDEFALTFDKAGNVSQSIRQQAYDLYNSKNWNDLEDLFSQNNLNGGWPPGNGGFNIVDDVSITVGQKFDRYGGAFGEANGNPVLGGSFTSPINNNSPYSFGQRALNGVENTYDFHYEIEVLQDLPFKAQNADVIPWFGQAGGGKQSMWKIPIDDATGYPKTWNKLAEEGYIKITIKDSPSGKFSNFTGTVIQN